MGFVVYLSLIGILVFGVIFQLQNAEIQKLKETNKKISALIETIQDDLDSKNNALKELERSHKETAKELTTTTSAKDQSIKALESKLLDVSNKYHASIQSEAKSKALHQDNNSTIKKLKEEIEELKAKRVSEEELKVKLEKQYDFKLNSEIERLIVGKDLQNTQLSENIKSLNDLLETRNKEFNKSEETNSQIISELKQLADSIQKKLDAKSLAYDKLQVINDSQREQIETKDARIKDLEEQQKRDNENFVAVSDKLARSEELVAELQETKKELEETVKHQTEVIDDDSKVLTLYEESVTSLNEYLSKQNQKENIISDQYFVHSNDEVKEICVTTRTYIDALTEKIAKLVESQESTSKDLKAANDKLTELNVHNVTFGCQLLTNLQALEEALAGKLSQEDQKEVSAKIKSIIGQFSDSQKPKEDAFEQNGAEKKTEPDTSRSVDEEITTPVVKSKELVINDDPVDEVNKDAESVEDIPTSDDKETEVTPIEEPVIVTTEEKIVEDKTEAPNAEEPVALETESAGVISDVKPLEEKKEVDALTEDFAKEADGKFIEDEPEVETELEKKSDEKEIEDEPVVEEPKDEEVNSEAFEEINEKFTETSDEKTIADDAHEEGKEIEEPQVEEPQVEELTVEKLKVKEEEEELAEKSGEKHIQDTPVNDELHTEPAAVEKVKDGLVEDSEEKLIEDDSTTDQTPVEITNVEDPKEVESKEVDPKEVESKEVESKIEEQKEVENVTDKPKDEQNDEVSKVEESKDKDLKVEESKDEGLKEEEPKFEQEKEKSDDLKTEEVKKSAPEENDSKTVESSTEESKEDVPNTDDPQESKEHLDASNADLNKEGTGDDDEDEDEDEDDDYTTSNTESEATPAPESLPTSSSSAGSSKSPKKKNNKKKGKKKNKTTF